MRQAVDLVDKQDVAALEPGQDRREVAGPLDGRAGCRPRLCAELRGYDGGQRRLAKAGWSVQEDMVDGL